jgi:hypothetical protein
VDCRHRSNCGSACLAGRIVLIAWTQRAPLSRLIGKLELRSLKWGDAEIAFGEALDRIEQTVRHPTFILEWRDPVCGGYT